MAKRNLNNVPGGAEVWKIGNEYHLKYDVPGTKPPVPMLYHVTRPADLEALFQGVGSVEADFTYANRQEAEKRHGAIFAGIHTGLTNTSDHPFEQFLHNYEKEAEVNPMLRDPEILALYAQGVLEGRTPTQSELAQTNYWKSRTPEQREWELFAAQDPRGAREKIRENRVQVRGLLREMGYEGDTVGLGDYYADKLTRGEMSEARLRESLRREVDPHADRASPFAGRKLPEDAQVLQRGDGKYVARYDGKDYVLSGPGQRARFAQGDVEVGRAVAGGGFFEADGNHFLRSSNGVWYTVNSPGHRRELERIYGAPRSVPSDHIGRVSGDSTDLFGREGEITELQPMAEEAGSLMDLFESLPDGGRTVSALGGEEAVRQLVNEWLGPVFAAGWTQEQIGKWASKIRDSEGARDQLVDELRRQRVAMFPEYENDNLSYEDIASPWRAFWQQQWGETPDEMDPLFARLVKLNDAEAASQIMRDEGVDRGKGTVVDQGLKSMGKAFGDGVSRVMM